MNKNQISKEFQKIKNDYDSLGKNIVDALKTFLEDENIPFLEIYYRVKKFDSFFEKIDRKGYDNPFEEIEDICGIRIICYYNSDISKIDEIINNEFSVIEQQDKSDLLGLKEFAYRSNHYIVKVNDSWFSAPNYRKLEGLKVEIQTRTILMHAWAEIEHKLNYKSDAQVPDIFQRKLFRLSAKFEEADEQFEELRVGINEYKNQLLKKVESKGEFDYNQDFNMESFKAFLKLHFTEEFKNRDLNNIFEEFSNNNISFKLINDAIEHVKPNFAEIKQDLLKSDYKDISNDPIEYLYMSMDIYDDDTYRRRDTMKSWKRVVDIWRKK